MNPRILLLTLLTLIAFASNSVLCRLALAGHSIEPENFTVVRIATGVIALCLVSGLTQKARPWGNGSWLSGALLFLYAIAFSLAYVNLSAGTGGLILFGSVQFTMIGVGIWKGERPSPAEWLGLVIAQTGLIILVFPGLHAPSPVGALLMITAGAAWGLYSLRGKLATNPTLATADNFMRALPMATLVAIPGLRHTQATSYGFGLAVVSGAVTSGIGYVLWYSVLPHLTATRAAITQLAVPAIVAIGGVLFLSEKIDARFLIASAMMLGGVATAVIQKGTRATS